MPPGSQVIDALWHCLCPSASLVRANGKIWKKGLSWGEETACQRLMSRGFHTRTTRCLSEAVTGSGLQRRSKARLHAHKHHPTQSRWMETQAQAIEQPWPAYEEPAPSPTKGANPWRKAIKRVLRTAKAKEAAETPNVFDREAVPVSESSVVEPKPRFDFKNLSKTQLEHNLQKGVDAVNYKTIHFLVKALIEGHGEQPSTKLYTCLIQANADPAYGSAEEVRELLTNMEEDKCPPNSTAYHAALEALSIHTDHLLRTSILTSMSAQWIELSPAGYHSVLVGLLRDRQIEQALLLLEKMHASAMRIRPWLHDMVCYTLLEAGDFDHCLRLMQHRVAMGETAISGALWSHMLDTASQAMHYPATKYVWKRRVQEDYLNPPSGVCINVLNVAAREADFYVATDVVRILARRSTALQLHHYEPLLESYLAADDLRSTLSIILTMPVQPSDATMRPLFAYLRTEKERAHEALTTLHALQSSTRKNVPTVCINTIIEAFIDLQDLDSAIAVYKVMHKLCPAGPDTRTFNNILRGCTYARRRETAMFFAAEMLARKIKPDALTYDRLILGCLAGTSPGDGQEGLQSALAYWDEMLGEGFIARRGTVTVLVRRCVDEKDARGWDVLEQGEQRGLDLVGLRGWVEGGKIHELEEKNQAQRDREFRDRERMRRWNESWVEKE